MLFGCLILKILPGSNWKIQIIEKLFHELPGNLELDLKNGLFVKYQAYTTSLNVELVDIDSAVVFNNFHEGIHLGVILSLRKLI